MGGHFNITRSEAMCLCQSSFTLAFMSMDVPSFAIPRHNNVAILRDIKFNAIGPIRFATRRHDNLAILRDMMNSMRLIRLTLRLDGTTA